MGTNVANINLSEIEAQVNAMSEEDIRRTLVEAKVRQKVAQKKYSNPEAQKAYRVKRAQLHKQLAERAKALGIYDEILGEAAKLADEKLAEEDTVAAEAE